MIELLSPAKNLEVGKAAILSGADAVYIGAAKFGARAAAGNSLDDIRLLAEFAHAFFAKVYVTVNTLLYDDELALVEELCHRLYEAGADAIIIQDTAILQMQLPPITIHASTQMHNHTPERINLLNKAGIERVVLARELTIDQIKEIKANTNTELEAFIHGSLCVSYSGRCFMSESIGGRSANRGECAQPCRKKYSLNDDKGNVLINDRHLLSLRDLNQTDNIGALMDAGIYSFKIEGRLKDLDYVKNITAWYRKVIDKELSARPYLKRASSGITTTAFEPDPHKSFNRGYTHFFINGRSEITTNHSSPKSLGKPVGTVKSILGKRITLNVYDRSTDDIGETLKFTNGDGLCWYDKNNNLNGSYINHTDNCTLTLGDVTGIEPGTVVMRNYDKVFIEQIQRADAVERKIQLDVKFEESLSVVKLSSTDEDGIVSEASAEIDKVPATSIHASDKIKEQIVKSGGTIFSIMQIDIQMQQNLFMKASFLNNLRRELLNTALENRLAFFAQRRNEERLSAIRDKNIGSHDTLQKWEPDKLTTIENIANAQAAMFYEAHGMKEQTIAEFAGLDFRKPESSFKWPLMTTKMCVKYELGKCPVHQNAAQPLPARLMLVNDTDKFRLEFDCKACVMRVYKD